MVRRGRIHPHLQSSMITRRNFFGMVGVAAAGAVACTPAISAQAGGAAFSVIRPRRLRPGATVGLVSPGSPVAEAFDIQLAQESFAAMGLQVRLGRSVRDRRGYLAGTDEDRAADLNGMFADREVEAIFALRGGWGSARILPLLDFDAIRRNPKIFLGYSDITALLNAIHARTGLVTFHGPMGISRWGRYPYEHFRRLLFDAEALEFANPVETGDDLVQREHRVQTITPGTARGRLFGGNLAVLSAIIGSDFLPDWNGAILFLEDIDEGIHRMDRMLTQLRLAGVLSRIRGFVFGKCTNCGPDNSPGGGYGSLTLQQVLNDHVQPLGIPAWSGAMIGHIANQWTLPVGAEVEIDAARGTIRMLQPAVT
jgi:muramoyltetrapeptide carboxypeptidase